MEMFDCSGVKHSTIQSNLTYSCIGLDIFYGNNFDDVLFVALCQQNDLTWIPSQHTQFAWYNMQKSYA